jgi:transcription-repair coupling factor (superfamily II helicase)
LLEDFLRQESAMTFHLVQGYHVTSLNAPSSESALCEDVAFYLQNGSLAVYAGSAARATYLPNVLNEHGISCALLREDAEIPKGAAAIIGQGFPGGFYDRDAKFAVLGSTRLSGKKKKRHSRYKPGAAINDFSDIKIGDYVVHENYGIGVYDGVHRVTTQGVTREFIRIRYAGTDTLFIPCGQFDLISKYVGASDEVKVKLNKLGTGEWAKAKARVKANVKDLAQGLIALYSARQNAPGFAFSPDNEWQQQFESAFEFEETEDQALCTAEIKADMEKSAPMDRLLCGDVGFGKTEVALRAAFKCVLDAKQVAMLTPTTLLAWQHYNTMLRRFEGFPVTIELLSRFRTPQQQEAILRKVRRGEIDILVGTHRLLQKDVKFKDLGLLIVDEEQRFGVSHKENLKEIAKNVDVLTLSATPIPRTLNMALSGIRDMSVIDTPPNDRHPISTYVCEYDASLIMDALRRELGRGGQCYYLHNRVETIYKTANMIAEAIPDATVEVAHGQMAKEELGEIWDRMTEGKIDILVCTTIIETGVDVPNANTLVIENADCLGLAQLHQIRGRVGRSYKHAYAYFTYRQGRTLTEDGRKRLDAIREYTEFGSGFKIAMRDLQIRGAGNLLGAQQHGHMDSVGYDMYMQLLNQAINEERGIETKAKLSECLIDLKVSAFIPEDYIDSSLARVDIYKKIAAIENEQDVSDIVDELIERFGDPPREVLALMDVSLVRAQCTACGVTELTEKNKMLIIKFAKFDMKKIANVISAMKGNMFFSAGTDPYLSCRIGGNALDTAIEVCQKLTEVFENEERE